LNVDPYTLELWKVNIDVETHDEHSFNHLRPGNLEGIEEVHLAILVGSTTHDVPSSSCEGPCHCEKKCDDPTNVSRKLFNTGQTLQRIP